MSELSSRSRRRRSSQQSAARESVVFFSFPRLAPTTLSITAAAHLHAPTTHHTSHIAQTHHPPKHTHTHAFKPDPCILPFFCNPTIVNDGPSAASHCFFRSAPLTPYLGGAVHSSRIAYPCKVGPAFVRVRAIRLCSFCWPRSSVRLDVVVEARAARAHAPLLGGPHRTAGRSIPPLKALHITFVDFFVL